MVPKGNGVGNIWGEYIPVTVFVSLLFLTCIVSASATVRPVEEWNKSFGGPLSEECRHVKQTSDGGYILTGFTYSSTNGQSDLWVVRTDPRGNQLWAQNYGGTGDDAGHYVFETPEQGFLLAGTTRSYGSGDYDAWLLKTDPLGKVLWEKTYGGPRVDNFRQVRPANDGGYIAVGSTSSYGKGRFDLWLVKTDLNGNKTWDKTFGGPSNDEGFRVTPTPDNGYIITGYTESSGSGGKDIWMIKTDLYGNKIWDKTFGGSLDDDGRSVKNTEDGGFIVSGYTDAFGSGGYDFWEIKTDSMGNRQWDKTFGGTYDDINRPVLATDDGGYVLGGWTGSKGAGGLDGWIVKTDPMGIMQWNMTLGGPKDDKIIALNQTSDGGFVGCGSTESFAVGETDLWFVKIGLPGEGTGTISGPLTAGSAIESIKTESGTRPGAAPQAGGLTPATTQAYIPLSLTLISIVIACSAILHGRNLR